MLAVYPVIRMAIFMSRPAENFAIKQLL